jgi:hypothetical protein
MTPNNNLRAYVDFYNTGFKISLLSHEIDPALIEVIHSLKENNRNNSEMVGLHDGFSNGERIKAAIKRKEQLKQQNKSKAVEVKQVEPDNSVKVAKPPSENKDISVEDTRKNKLKNIEKKKSTDKEKTNGNIER